MDNAILYAAPIFLLLIGIEVAYGYRQHNNTYRTQDAITSIATGLLSQSTRIITQSVLVTIYTFSYQHLTFIKLGNNVFVWLLGFVFFDLCYYWFHRVAHEYNIFWASHVTHHSSEDFNLSTALRQGSTTFWFAWVFYLPMALCGIPPIVFLGVYSLNMLYQFWVHTQHIDTLGWCEKHFVTPSHHRVHHGQNEQYIDRNYGGVFIWWDKYFGSFQQELSDEPVVYGITQPVKSWNPLWVTVHYFVQLFNDFDRCEHWQDKLRLWFMPTGWRPSDVAEKYPIEKTTPFTKFDTHLGHAVKMYAFGQFLFVVMITLYVLANAASFWILESLFWIATIGFWLYSLALFIEKRPASKYIEPIRVHLYSLFGMYCFDQTWAIALLAIYYLQSTISYFVLSPSNLGMAEAP